LLPQTHPQEIVVATNNPGKTREIQEILKDFPCQVLSISLFSKDFFVEEDGQTYRENAIKKAKHAVRVTGKIAIADDSGLEVDALGGAPGIYSARFGGKSLSYSEKNTLLLQKLEGVAERTARFRCIIAIASPEGKTDTAEGVCEGIIGTEARGTFGFGFDPVFIVPEYQKTMAELEPKVKNTISHRARALKYLPEIIKPFLK
jgi:XTP/dITP diphosphohydrolase